MSRRKVGLSSPPVVAGVLVVLAVLIVVNVRTFAPRRPHRAQSGNDSSAEVRVQAHPSLPLDLEDVMRPSGQESAELGRLVTGPRPDVARDPFTVAAAAPAVASLPAAPRAARKAAVGLPVCTAVMLGAGAPLALVDGRLCRVGDHVGRYVIERIDARGVSLGGERKLHLPVGVVSAGEGSNVVVTGKASGDGQGRTSLVEYADSERKSE